MITTVQVRSKGADYDVALSRDGDHIVTKRDKRDPLHAYPVDGESGTFARVVVLAETWAQIHAS